MNDGIDVESLRRVARAMAATTSPRRARGLVTASASSRTSRDVPSASSSPMDAVVAMPAMPLELIGGRGHYERVIDAVRNAQTSVWIATANVKELMIEDSRARPGRRRSMKRSAYVSVLAILDELAARGIEIRLLHAELPSRPFREEIANHPRLLGAGGDEGLALRRCPRVHMKVVVVDGELLYLGSANWTGAGLGAKGSGRRNFELGIVTGDAQMLDHVQRLYDHVWRGAECQGCRLRAECPGPLVDLGQRTSDAGPRTSDAGPRTSDAGQRTPDAGPRTSDAGRTRTPRRRGKGPSKGNRSSKRSSPAPDTGTRAGRSKKRQ